MFCSNRTGVRATTVNDIVKLDATLHLDCEINDGTLKGKISFSGCH